MMPNLENVIKTVLNFQRVYVWVRDCWNLFCHWWIAFPFFNTHYIISSKITVLIFVVTELVINSSETQKGKIEFQHHFSETMVFPLHCVSETYFLQHILGYTGDQFSKYHTILHVVRFWAYQFIGMTRFPHTNTCGVIPNY
jgi:hypothetical protein